MALGVWGTDFVGNATGALIRNAALTVELQSQYQNTPFTIQQPHTLEVFAGIIYRYLYMSLYCIDEQISY